MRCARCYDTEFATAASELTIDDMIPLSIDLPPILSPGTLLDPLSIQPEIHSSVEHATSRRSASLASLAPESRQATHCGCSLAYAYHTTAHGESSEVASSLSNSPPCDTGSQHKSAGRCVQRCPCQRCTHMTLDSSINARKL